MTSNISHCAKSILIVIASIWLVGCATYGSGLEGAITQLKQENYSASEAEIKKVLKPEGKDRLLYHLELSTVKYLAGEYEESNQLLETAERIADDLETSRLSDALVTLMSNPRKGTYAGADYERILINYFKALNYFQLAQRAESSAEYQQALDGARVESRRLIMRINDINTRRGHYQVTDEKEQKFAGIIKILAEVLVGNLADLKSIQYRDDAMAHYLTGISFEMKKEYDDARISYQNAANAYENGYAEQYYLDQQIIAQAWFDVVRMMRKVHGYEQDWQRIAKQKLTEEQRAQLEDWSTDKAQLIVLEHKGFAPHRQEMNLVLTLNEDLHAFQLHPVFETGNEDALNWFYMLYADKGIAGLVSSFMVAKKWGVATYGFTKTVPLGPLWHDARSLGLLDAMDPALRAAVPYYRPVEPLPKSTLQVNEQSYSLIKSSNPALMAVQEQMRTASGDIYQALARAAFKAVTAQQVGNAAGGEYGALFSLAAKVAFQFTEAAETRNWLLLPQDIRIKRLVLEPGTHQLTLNSQFSNGMSRKEQQIELQAEDIYLWQVRTIGTTD